MNKAEDVPAAPGKTDDTSQSTRDARASVSDPAGSMPTSDGGLRRIATAWRGRGRAGAGLSARLLILLVSFVMLSEVLIYVPSIARFRLTWLEDHLNAALIATLALDVDPDIRVSDAVRQELLAHAGAVAVSLKRVERRELILRADLARVPDGFYDLREVGPLGLIADAFETLFAGDGRLIRVAGEPEMAKGQVIDVVLDETPLRRDMLGYSGRILTLSIVISLLTAGLFYLALHWVLLGPMRRLTDSMIRFRVDPEDASRVFVTSNRHDEIGVAEQALSAMQTELRAALNQKSHLAALGAAVSKINHDLRNVLASVQLFSDRFAESDDPRVQSQLPKLMRAIDRAIQLTTDTLRYGRAEEPPPNMRRFGLAALVDEVGAALPVGDGAAVRWVNAVDPGLEVVADSDQVYRILLNLGRNAVEAFGTVHRRGAIVVEATANGSGDAVSIDMRDDGPGIPAATRGQLFKAFAAGRRGGGTGLGLAISRELARAHGGELDLVSSDAGGSLFRLTLPDRHHIH